MATWFLLACFVLLFPRRYLSCVPTWFFIVSTIAAPLFAQTELLDKTVAEVRIEQEGLLVRDSLITNLIATDLGESLSMRDVRQTVDHLMGIGRFEDIQALAEVMVGGVRLTYRLIPTHPVDQLLFQGELELPEEDIQRVVMEEFEGLPDVGQESEVQRILAEFFKSHGFLRTQINYQITQEHDPHRSILTFFIDAGERVPVRHVHIRGLEGIEARDFKESLPVQTGRPFNRVELEIFLKDYEQNLREREFYEARVVGVHEFVDGSQVDITIDVNSGSRTVVVFTGDPVAESILRELIPIKQEMSVDEDLLENSALALRDYWVVRGYPDASVEYTREDHGSELVVAFEVLRGRHHIIDTVEFFGSSVLSNEGFLDLLGFKEGDSFVRVDLRNRVSQIQEIYYSRGYAFARVSAAFAVQNSKLGVNQRFVRITFTVDEGIRTVVGNVGFEGNAVFTDLDLRSIIETRKENSYLAEEVHFDQDRIRLAYLDRGYQNATVEVETTLNDDRTSANVRFVITEGFQVIIDQIIVVGNQGTSVNTIMRALTLRPGEPLGTSAMLESRQRLVSLGLFSAIRITDRRHGAEPLCDVIVAVEESPRTTLGYGGGLEGGMRLRPTAEGGKAEERFELAPRGFFEIGRRNLWGKNRSINLFTRVSLRTRDSFSADNSIQIDSQQPGEYGFNEYRIVGTYREPRILNTTADASVTGIVDQAIRSSFNFKTREIFAEAMTRLSPRFNVLGRYSYKHTELFDERFTTEEKPLIDRLFPQVRLSRISVSLLLDTRDDLLDPSRGVFFVADNDLAARALGSEVGFMKTYLQAFTYYRFPLEHRVILALGGRLGAAHGFRRTVTRLLADGEPVIGQNGQPIIDTVEDLPASERFFAGGDTTVRGFSLDRLGDEQTITASGFPTGGNGLILLNAELRFDLFGPFGAAVFLDAGNVFPKANDLDFTRLRGSVGFGIQYQSPVGPVRVDLGFKLNRLNIGPSGRERSSVLHVSLGRAF